MDKIANSIRKEIQEMSPYAGGEVIDIEVKLNQNESPFNLPKKIIEKIKQKMDSIKFNRYNEGSLKRLRELTAKKFNVDANQIIYGCGIDELLYYLTMAVVDKGNKIVRPVPSFGMYRICSKVFGANDTPVMLDKNFELTEEFVKESKDAKLTFICRPNSQTANSWDKKTIEKIVKETSGIVCIDEAYAEFANDDCMDLLKYDNVVIMRTFSKAYLAAGLRLGYAIGNKRMIELMNRVRLPWNVNVVSQAIGEIILENEEIFQERLDRIKENRSKLIEEMKKIVKVLPTETNFISFEVKNPKQICAELKTRGVLIRDISKYPMLENFLRVNVGTNEENKKFIETLKSILAGRNTKLNAIIFDIDGVLVDVSKSYREAIKLTVEKFSGRKPSDEEIEAVKKKPNSNNDWVVTYALATDFKRDLSKIDRNDGEYLKMKAQFQEYYLGGLIDNEELLIKPESFKKLEARGIRVGVVTSRPRYEALYVLKRIGKFNEEIFDEELVVAQEDCDEEKPSPKPIRKVLERMKIKAGDATYIGDTINDKLAANMAEVMYEEVNSEQNVNDILRRLLK
ncbi:MAG: histidinol-phosphate transaminase [Candidatus Micrarchaeota archaeon]